jgi:hypothetical protein
MQVNRSIPARDQLIEMEAWVFVRRTQNQAQKSGL